MLSKFSVKKPYTVWVCLAMVVILGIVSFTKMKADLLPSMNLPYSVVYATYPGASPEEIEETVTRPIESSMATVSNIEKVSSISSENLSVVILQFADDTNMDSANIEMREKLDTLGAKWGDKVTSPVIMNINPDMIPVMIAAVDVEGYEGAELSNYVEDNLLSKLESIDGVAQVTSTGGVEETLSVTISPEKIAATNELVKEALDKKFNDAKSEISNAKSKINSGISQVTSGTSQIEAAKQEIANKQSELNTQLSEAKSKADSSLTQIIETKIEINNKISELQSQKLVAQNQRNLYTTPEYIKDMDPDFVAGEIVKLDIQISQLDIAIGNLNTTLAQLETGKVAAEDALKQIEAQESSANYQLYSALVESSSTGSTLTSTKSNLESSKSQLESSEETLNKTIDSTYESLDLNKLITRSMLEQIITAQNFSMPAGYINDSEGEKMLVRVGDKFINSTEIEDVVILDLGLDGLDPIKMSDVADIEIEDNSSEVYAKINGNDGILLTFDKQDGYSTGDVADSIKLQFESISNSDTNVTFSVLMDQGIYIDYVISSVFENLLWGALFAIIILIFFLKSVKPTIIIAVSIPASLLFAIALMYFCGISINMISLSGLALAVGMLVDNSIVVIENIYRMRGEGVPLLKACVDGAKQVAGAIIASTLTTCCVFLPIVFTTGITKQLFVDLGLTITFSLMASLIVALTVVPAMSAGLLKTVPEKKNKLLERIIDLYGKGIEKSLDKKAIVIILSVVLLAGSTYFAIKNGTSFMPSMESTQVTVSITPLTDVTFEEATEYSDKVSELIQSIDGVETVGAMAGQSGMGSMMSMGSSSSDNSISMYIIFDEDKSISNSEFKKIVEGYEEDGGKFKIGVASEMSDMTALMGTGITVNVMGDDADTIIALANELAVKMEDVAGLTEIDSGVNDTTPEFRISIDKDKAVSHNLTVAQIYQQVYAKLSTATSSNTLKTDVKDYDIYVYDGSTTDFTTDNVKSIEITAKDSEGNSETILLSDVATFESAEGLSSINRINQHRNVSVKAEVLDDYNVGNVGNDVQKIIDGMDIPEGYSVTVAGQNEQINDAIEQLILMTLLGVVLVYLVMVAQFQSLKMPFIIMFTIPLAFTGGFLGLVICGMDVSVVSLLGFVILTGVIVNNGIVLVDYINQLRYAGKSKREAIIEAGKTRLRPILMTAITTILGLLMMAIGVGLGSDLVQPLAVVTIGGMVYGTFMTLFIVPCIYDIIAGKKELIEKDVD